MKQKGRILFGLVVLMLTAALLAACNVPANTTNEDEDPSIQQTSVAETVEASLLITQEQEAATDTPQVTQAPTNTPVPSEAPDATATGENTDVVGEDRAEFVADVTIPDYSEHLVGTEITKTWRIRNVGESTWTTDYYLDFDKGEKLGASDTSNLPKEVGPNDFVDISVDFIVPDATGEYTSYWHLRNADDELVGIDEEDTPLSLYMVINAVSAGGAVATSTGTSGGSSGGISGGAKVTGATVSVDDSNYSGSCPADVTFTYTVTTSNAGKVNFQLVLTAVSPAAYTFDPTPEYSINFTGGYTVTYTYTLISSSSVTATAKVVAVGSNTYNSSPINFKINCN
ncbi:MAG: NBR1-Ig-like domain-containing protein [Anaerolineales bacterium]